MCHKPVLDAAKIKDVQSLCRVCGECSHVQSIIDSISLSTVYPYFFNFLYLNHSDFELCTDFRCDDATINASRPCTGLGAFTGRKPRPRKLRNAVLTFQSFQSFQSSQSFTQIYLTSENLSRKKIETQRC